MFFLLPMLVTVAETAAAVTGTILAATGPIGTTLVTATTAIGGAAGGTLAGVATTLGVEAATATAIGTITAGATTTTLNVGVIENGVNMLID